MISDSRGLLSVDRFEIPLSVLETTLAAVLELGNEGLEVLVAWAGRREADVVTVTGALVPRQTALRTPDGLLVVVEGAALFDLNRSLFESGDLLVGQAHSHGELAYHSETDDHEPIATMLGALSVVVPHFGRGGLVPQDWFWARLVSRGYWQEVSFVELIRVV